MAVHTHTHTRYNLKNGKNEGVTLIALVITIIVLLILAGVSIATLTGENGILNKATQAKKTNVLKAAEEKVKLAVMASYKENGEIDIAELGKNLEAIDGIDEDFDSENFTLDEDNNNTTTVKVDGQEIVLTLTANNTVTVEAKEQTNSTEPSTQETPEEPNPPEELVTHKVTLNANGGTIVSGDVTRYTEGQETTLPTEVTKEGYTFVGWYEKNDFTGDRTIKISTTDKEDKTYYANWDFGPITGSYTRTDASGYPKTMEVLDVSDVEKIKVSGVCSNSCSIYFNTGEWTGTGLAGEKLHDYVSGSFEVELDVKNYSEVYLLHAGLKDSMISYTVTKQSVPVTDSFKYDDGKSSEHWVCDVYGYKSVRIKGTLRIHTATCEIGTKDSTGKWQVLSTNFGLQSSNNVIDPAQDFELTLDVSGYSDLYFRWSGFEGWVNNYTIEYLN